MCAAIDGRVEARSMARRAFPDVRLFADLPAALPDVDGVIIATPPSTHEALALTAMRAGKHVLVEKPMATSAASARRLVDEAAASSVTLMVGHTFEYSDAVHKLHEIVESGDLGVLLHIDTARLNLGLYQNDVNVVWDLAPHDVSIVNYLMGVPPSTVQVWGSCHVHPTLEDVAYLRLYYGETNVSAVINVSWLSPCKVRRVTVVGTKKMAVYDDMAEEPVRIYDKGVMRAVQPDDFPAMPMSYRYGDIVSPYVAIHEPLMREDEHFIHSIRSGTRPRTDGSSGLAVVRVLEAASLSLNWHAEISLESREPAAWSRQAVAPRVAGWSQS